MRESMKLRYYLRGLGIGMAVTALILGASFSTRKQETMTDAQIKERAAELGMVESDSLKLSDLQANTEPEVTEAPEATASPKTTEEPEATASPEVTEKPEATASSKTTEEPEATAFPEVTEKPEATASPEATETTETVTITVKSGDSSDRVSKALAEAGLVEDAGAFDAYLCDNGYSRSISVGTYEIPLDADEEEIAKIITRKR